MKKSLTAIIAATVFLSGTPGLSILENAPGELKKVEAATFNQFKGTSTADLNIRSGPSTKYKKMGLLKKNSVVTVIGSSGEWYKISYKGKAAYVSAKYIKKNSTTSTFKQFAVVTTDALNVRQARSASAKKMGQLSKGTKVTVLGSKAGWYTIKYKGKTGYISSKYTKKVSTSLKVQYYASVISSKSYVRTGTSTKYKIVGTLKKGTKVGVYGTANGYSKILFEKSYRFIKSSDIKKAVISSKPTTPSKPTVPSVGSLEKPNNVPGYELQTGSYALALNFNEVDKVNVSNSFSYEGKVKEVKALAESIGAKSNGSVINLVNTVDSFESLDDVKIAYDFAYGSQKFKMYYSSGRDLRLKESKYMMKIMLKPYLPNGYESVVNKYFDGQYYGGDGYGPYEVDGYTVTFNAGSIRFEK
ncbi:SH3 domain-containing protein [Exiguobacterium antarcticum]|uniref:SH3 domain-containing protein n=1 Tax=Exiguobacterium antarcticum TaxID=132920 RepID=A0ABT6R4T6_9BACL|nr:SH3 domain-containing protein [Exiguobacterium antarcticum]MDI3235973.1 SH3 domain-containing protein [Exiguobacterium antarcticum]